MFYGSSALRTSRFAKFPTLCLHYVFTACYQNAHHKSVNLHHLCFTRHECRRALSRRLSFTETIMLHKVRVRVGVTNGNFLAWWSARVEFSIFPKWEGLLRARHATLSRAFPSKRKRLRWDRALQKNTEMALCPPPSSFTCRNVEIIDYSDWPILSLCLFTLSGLGPACRPVPSSVGWSDDRSFVSPSPITRPNHLSTSLTFNEFLQTNTHLTHSTNTFNMRVRTRTCIRSTLCNARHETAFVNRAIGRNHFVLRVYV